MYEYRCLDCTKRSVFFIPKPDQFPLTCKHGKSDKLERLRSRFASPTSEEARMEALANPSDFGDFNENDPKSMARFMKKMGREMGEDLGGDFDEAIGSMEGGDMKPTLPGLDEQRP